LEDAMQYTVYVLNNNYQCISVCSFNRALALVEQKKAEVVKYAEHVVHTVSRAIQVPLIIKLFRFIKAFNRKVNFSKNMVLDRDDYTCQYCGKRILNKSEITIDHVVPKSRGGKSTFENVVAACSHCNRKKHNRLPVEANMFPIKKPTQPSITRRMKTIMDDVEKILLIE